MLLDGGVSVDNEWAQARARARMVQFFRSRSKYFQQIIFFIVSGLLVASAQPDWSVIGSILTSCLGYALFWKGAALCTTRRATFLTALIWFGCVSGIHLSWFFADRYVGIYIYPFLAGLFLALGAQFGLLTCLIGNPRELSTLKIIAVSAVGTLFEWIRLFALVGFTLDPIGISLTGTLSGMQMASLFGIYGLTFWVLCANLCALRLLSQFSWRILALWGAIAAFPYVFGSLHLFFHKSSMEKNIASLKALAVQTALTAEDKVPINGSIPIPVVEQWRRILLLLAPYLHQHVDLIVLPEGTVPYGTDVPIYAKPWVQGVFQQIFGTPVTWPFSVDDKVGNYYWAACLAAYAQTNVIVGLEEVDGQKAYNSAFLVKPDKEERIFYRKRVLVPMGEYIPFRWCQKILSKYGIVDSYTAGEEAGLFKVSPDVTAGVSICYEETYGHLVRQLTHQGANLLINLTNDIWFPKTRLPLVHFFHGRLRAVEMGCPIIRSCNTGVTCGIDSLGRLTRFLPFETAHADAPAAVLSVNLPLYHYETLYARYGNCLIIGFSCIYLMLFGILQLFKVKHFALVRSRFYPLRKN